LPYVETASNRRFRGIFYRPIQNRFFLILSLILGTVFFLLFINVVGAAFKTLFPTMGSYGILLILATCLLGSYVNIPIKRNRTLQPRLKMRRVTVFGVTYPVPSYHVGFYESLVAINIGGAIVPTVTSLYLMTKTTPALPNIVAAVAIVAIVVKAVSRPVKGAGIIVPVLIPPVTAAIVGMLLGGDFSYVVTYVSGTLGTLIGADLLNFNKILKIGAPVISIGGAGTFDGIFLAGIMGVLIAF
jgi:uncharacterized membrane protein